MIDLTNLEAWFVAGSQHLYGPEALKQVEAHSIPIASALAASPDIPVKIVAKPVMTSSESIHQLCLDANGSKNCIGLITWMHTFSPARMWIAGLRSLTKPFLHLHTQFNEELPWSNIDMNFMNLNQSAHGDREFGFIGARMRLERKIVVGFWQDTGVHAEIGVWTRSASAWHDAQRLKVARFGDNMRNVAVTEGDKVEAEIKLCYSVNGYGVGDLTHDVQQVSDDEIGRLTAELAQLPGIAVQRLMADGYGFGAEGDWKTAALVRAMKVMSQGLKGGTSFMEDYTYHFKNGGQVLGAHMLEVCPSLAENTPSAEIHPLSIGGKADPVRLVFTASSGSAVNASVTDLGNRFRLIVNQVNLMRPEKPLPKLPVARAIWIPEPNLKIAATAWISAGGAHHTALSRALSPQHLEDFAEMADIEYLLIDRNTTMENFKNKLKWNRVYYHFLS